MRMKVSPSRKLVHLRFIAAAAVLVFAAGCATTPRATDPADVAAVRDLTEARSLRFSPEEKVAHYLDAAALTAPRLGPSNEYSVARQTYNSAAGELTILLRSADGGKLWNHPMTVASGNTTYHLRIQPAGYEVWSPDYFTSFILSDTIKEILIKKENHQQGVGGSLVGVRVTTPLENFMPPKGITAAVTSTLQFKGSEATLTLNRPALAQSAMVEGRKWPLQADFSAPIAYYKPPGNLLVVGLRAMTRGGNYENKTGLFFMEPYDPDRIPIVFVHGLVSTPFTWVQTINGLKADPEIRKHYQFLVFYYPTGNPILYSALRLREELAKVDKLYPNHLGYVLVGHSMGGILTRTQVTTVTPEMWEREVSATKDILARNAGDSMIKRALTFQANPRIKRVVFVCTPHRGSDLATGGIGKIGISLIRLPLTLTSALTTSITPTELTALTGDSKRLPNSIIGLKPSNPAFKVINAPKMSVPYHSIIGDRGKGDTPNSTDGVVAYWSSHLDGAKSECIVPGPHSSCELPQTIKELDRILELHLKSVGVARPPYRSAAAAPPPDETKVQ
jgi:pimeloyl-ACP methyl ester carboxylesterase